MDVKVYFTGNIPHQAAPLPLETLGHVTAAAEVIATKEIPQIGNLVGRLKNPEIVERQIKVYLPFPYEKEQSPHYVVRDYARADGDEELVDGLVFVGRANYTSEELRRGSGALEHYKVLEKRLVDAQEALNKYTSELEAELRD